MGRNIFTGQLFGSLLVVRDSGIRKNRYSVWECKCDCGNIIYLDTRALQRGAIQDCGCKTKVKPGQKDLSGRRFGRLTALEPTDKRQGSSVVWKCRCDCGNEVFSSASQLQSGYKKSCNCLGKPGLKDWIGKRFGRLQVLEYAGKQSGKHYWKCKCDCGNIATVCQSNLKIGRTLSCGCLVDLRSNLHFVEGTSIEAIESKTISKSNTSGIRGVYQNKRNGRWVAQITFKGKTYYLGSYAKIDDAESARRKAEEKFFGGFLDWYYNDFMKR